MIHELLEDLRSLVDALPCAHPRYHAARLLRDTISRCAPVVHCHFDELRPQLIGRLLDRQDGTLQNLVSALSRNWHAPWLRPLLRTLSGPSNPLLHILQLGSGPHPQARFLPSDSHAIFVAGYHWCLWDWVAGLEERRFTTPGVFGHVVALPNEMSVHVGGDSLWLVNCQTGTVKVLAKPNSKISRIAIDSAGRHAFCGFEDGRLEAFAIHTGRRLWSKQAHLGTIWSVAVLLDGRIITSSADHTVQVSEIRSGRRLARLPDSWYMVSDTAPFPNCSLVALAACRFEFRPGEVPANATEVWDVDSGTLVRRFEHGTTSVHHVAVLPDERVVSALEGRLEINSLKHQDRACSLLGHSGQIECLAAHKKRCNALTTASDGSTIVWDFSAEWDSQAEMRHSDAVTAIELLPRSEHALTAGNDGMINVWDLRGPYLSQSFCVAPPRGRWGTLAGGNRRELFVPRSSLFVESLAAFPNGQYTIYSLGDATSWIRDLSTGEVVFALGNPGESSQLRAAVAIFEQELGIRNLFGSEFGNDPGGGAFYSAFCICRDNRHLLCGSIFDNVIYLVDLCDKAIVNRLVGHTGRITRLLVFGDAPYLLSSSWDGSVRIWNLGTWRQECVLTGHRDRVEDLVLLPEEDNYQAALSASADGSVILWDLNRRCLSYRFEPKRGPLTSLALLRQNRFFAVGGADHCIEVWSIESRHPVTCFTGESPVRCLAAGHDSDTRVVGEASGRVHFLRLELLGE